MSKYTAIFVEEESSPRNRLKQAAAMIPSFGKLSFVNNLKECVREISQSKIIDIIFVACRLGQEDIKNFISQAKALDAGKDTAYVLVLSTDEQDNSTVANAVIYGVDGFLLEPFSVDNLATIADLAQRIKKERSSDREIGAFKFLLKDVMRQLDRVAFIKSCNFDVALNMKKFSDMTSTIRNVSPEKRELYYEAAFDVFCNAPVPELPEAQNNYKGVSERVKKRMEQKIVEQMLKEAEQDEKQRAFK
jgi:DNA-binding NarL/FixJ family response regulator